MYVYKVSKPTMFYNPDCPITFLVSQRQCISANATVPDGLIIGIMDCAKTFNSMDEALDYARALVGLPPGTELHECPADTNGVN
jgi:hypothetical protein